MVKVITPPPFKQRLLKGSNSTYIPSIWFFLDTETVLHTVQGESSHFFTLGWSCLWIRKTPPKKDSYEWVYHQTFEGLNRYIEGIALKIGNMNIIGHNIFFDLQASGFYQYFTEHGWKLKFYYDKGLTYILKCEKDGASITIVSSTNWFDFSLQKLGAALGYPKLDIDFDKCTRDELKIYCRRDVEILVKAVNTYIGFIIDYNLGKFSLTKASQAFTAFRHRFMTHKILIHTHQDTINLERAAYQGGRCECFFVGTVPGGPFVTLDVNAMYPFVMRQNKYPYKLIAYYENKSPKFFTGKLENACIIAEVEVNTCDPVFAIKQKGKTIFPTGKFNAVVASTGFQYGLDKGYIKHVLKAAVYLKADLFSAYVNFFHDLRIKFKNEGNDMFLLLCKYMHNSLYGKFGQLKIVSDIEDFNNGHEYYREEIPNFVTGRTHIHTYLMNQRIIQYPEGEGEYSNVAIAAHITENARFYLWSIIQRIGPSKVLYCDTDSVKIRSKHIGPVKALMGPDTLGMLKVEDESKTLLLEGAKNYRTESKRKIKGIPHKAIEIRPGVFQFTSFVRQVSHLRTGQITGAKVKVITRALKHTYSKGTILASGKVIPFHLNQPL